jgi:HlyD family secretion protein
MTPQTKPTEPLSTSDLQTMLNEAPARAWWRRPVVWGAVALVAGVAGGIYYWQVNAQRKAAPVFVTEPISQGNLTLTVSANGTLQPTRSVSIGSELSGTVLRVLVDVNDRVKKGQVLVELDTAKLSDQVARSRASLNSAIAQVAQAVATVTETQGNLARLEEVARISGGKVPSKAELDTGRATLARAQAAEVSARANVTVAQATLSTDETNLSKASIRSPTDGVVLTRTVDPGNAVAASLQAVTLFTIAEDLTRLRLQVNVDEADVGSVKVGQKASFTVSAYPARSYPASLTRVAFGSTITENVVTYITYLDVDNADLSLRPGMTASSIITATERRDVLLAPNTALRFTPAQNGANGANQGGGGVMSSLMPRMPRTGPRKAATGSGPNKQVWVLEAGAAKAVAVSTGISDGRMTEITGGDLKAGMLIITDQRTAGSAP